MRLRAAVPAFAVAALLLVAGAAVAHDVSPNSIQLRPGARDYIYVLDPSGCHADITATSSDPNVVKVYAADMNKADGSLLPGGGASVTVPFRIDQVFVVVAASIVSSPLAANVNICWVGEDFNKPSGFCTENNCSPPAPHAVSITVDPFATNAGSQPYGGIFGDPVVTATGELWLQEAPDLMLHGSLPLALVRRYSSGLLDDAIAATRLGPNWRHDFDWSLVRTGNNVEVTGPDGRVLRFEKGFFASAWTSTIGLDQPFDLIDAAPGFKLRDGRGDRILTFDASGVLTKIEDGKGSALTLTYTAGKLTSVSNGLGRVLTFTYDGSGRMNGASDGTRSVGFAYDGSGRLAAATDAAGNTTTYAYDGAQPAKALLTTRTLPEGNAPWTQVWDGSGRVMRQVDAFGNFFDLHYDTPSAGKTTTTDPLLQTQEHTHVGGKLTAQKFENGATAIVGSDAAGRRTAVTDRLNATTSVAYDTASRKVATVTEADGGTTSLTWTPRVASGFTFHDLTRVVYAGNRVETYAYDGSGNVTSRTDATGGVWARTYGMHGEVLTATDPTGGQWHYTWNADLLPATATDPNGNATTYSYDALARLIGVAHADGTSRSATWDELDRMITLTDEASGTTHFAWDTNGNLTGLMLPGGSTWSFTYDVMDRVSGALDPAGDSASWTLDQLGRPVGTTNAAGEALAFSWSSGNRLAGVTQGARSTSTVFDAEDVASVVVAPAGGSWSFLTGLTGHLTRADSPDGRVHRAVRDTSGRVIQRFDGSGFRTDFGYDLAGRPISASLPGTGIAASVDYDAKGRIEEVTRGTASWTIGRDAGGNATSFTDPNGRTTTATRDERGRAEVITFPAGLGSVTATWAPRGELARLQFSDGVDLQYTYDDVGRVLTAPGVTLARDGQGRITGSNGVTAVRDEVGRLAGLTFGVGKTITYGYDVGGHLTSVSDWVGGSLTIGYDSSGRVNDRLYPNGVHETRTYDGDGWLAGIHTVAPSLSVLGDLQLVRDGDYRITQATRTQPVTGLPAIDLTTHSYDAAGEDDEFTFDGLGRRLTDPWSSYTYDLPGRLTAATDWSDSFTYGWNGLGNVETIASTMVSGAFQWNYATAEPSVAVMQVNGVDAKAFVATPKGDLLWSIDLTTSARLYYHFDEAGNTSYTTDDAGAVVDAYAWSPTAKLLAHNGPGSSYPFGEFAAKGESFTVSLGVGLAFKDRVYDVRSGTTLQPTRAPALLSSLSKSPYAIALFPTPGHGDGGIEATDDASALQGTLDPFAGMSLQQIRALGYGTPPEPTASAGDPAQPPADHLAFGGTKCGDCHPDGLGANLGWNFAVAARRGGSFDPKTLFGGGFGGGGGAIRVSTAFSGGGSIAGSKGFTGTAAGWDPDAARIWRGIVEKTEREDRRNLRRAIVKLAAERRLAEFELGLLELGPFGFLNGDAANTVLDDFDDLLEELWHLGVRDADASFFDYLTDPYDGLGLPNVPRSANRIIVGDLRF